MDKWQPIETAPKNGSDILIAVDYGGTIDVVAAFWFAPWLIWHAQDSRGAVINEDTDEMFGIGSALPTHWMPLPLPPA
jgi:hypothetical protein